MKLSIHSVKTKLLFALIVSFCFPGLSSGIRGGKTSDIEALNSIKATGFVQISLSPTLGLARLHTTPEIYRSFLGLNGDTLGPNFVIAPYQVGLTLMIKLNAKNQPHLLDSIQKIELLLKMRLKSHTFLPPKLISPGFSTHRAIIINTDQGRKSERLFSFDTSDLTTSRKDHIRFDTLAKPLPLPQYFEPKRYAYAQTKSSEQEATMLLIGNKDTTRSFESENLFIINSGIVIMVDEVIDPENTLSFSIDAITMHSKNGDSINIKIDNPLSSMTMYFASDLTRDSTRKFGYVYPGMFEEDACAGAPRGKQSLNFNVRKDEADPQRTLWFRTIRSESSDSPHDTLLYQICDTVDDFSTFELSADSIAGGSFLGKVSSHPRDGYYPLWRATKRHSCDDHNLPRHRFALCMEDIIWDPCYDIESIFCYVVVPESGRTPCAP